MLSPALLWNFGNFRFEIDPRNVVLIIRPGFVILNNVNILMSYVRTKNGLFLPNSVCTSFIDFHIDVTIFNACTCIALFLDVEGRAKARRSSQMTMLSFLMQMLVLVRLLSNNYISS